MSDQPDAYYEDWAARLNLTPEFVADAERIAGKPVGDLIAENRCTETQMEQDAMLLGSAMARHAVNNLSELADAMRSDDDAGALRAALQRAITIMILGEGQGGPPSPSTNPMR